MKGDIKTFLSKVIETFESKCLSFQNRLLSLIIWTFEIEVCAEKKIKFRKLLSCIICALPTYIMHPHFQSLSGVRTNFTHIENSPFQNLIPTNVYPQSKLNFQINSLVQIISNSFTVQFRHRRDSNANVQMSYKIWFLFHIKTFTQEFEFFAKKCVELVIQQSGYTFLANFYLCSAYLKHLFEKILNVKAPQKIRPRAS